MRNNYYDVLQWAAISCCLIALSMLPVAAALPGQADIEINGAKSQLSGFCNTNEMVLQFWTDGNDGPAQRDLNGDGAYLDIMLHGGMTNMQGGALIQLMSGGEWIYKGIAKPAIRDGATLSLEHSYTRLASKGGGDFDIKVTVNCSN